jgi:thiamine biosynthesis lipoprotein
VLGIEVPVTTTTPYWLQREAGGMGSTVRIMVGGGDPQLLDWALDTVALLERTWSRFRADSELSRLNEVAGRWCPVTPTMLLALERAAQLWQLTGGAFDPTVLTALERAGYDTTFERVRDSDDEPEAEPAMGFGAVQIDVAGSAVLCPTGVRLDLGGVGKGLAADLVAEGLVARGATSALVSLGGDIRVAGTPPESGWDIPIEDPFCEQRTAFNVALASGAIVTSTTRFRTWQRGAHRMHHLIDPRTGSPADTGVVAVVASGAETWQVEGLAKASLIEGVERGAALLRRAHVTGWLVLDDHTVVSVAADAA